MVITASLVALLVVGTEDMGTGHTVFANRDSSGHVTNRGINVQTDTNQDQGCESAGGTSAITNACTATSGRGSTETSTETSVTLEYTLCNIRGPPINCSLQACNNIGCQSITCTGTNVFNNLALNCFVTDDEAYSLLPAKCASNVCEPLVRPSLKSKRNPPLEAVVVDSVGIPADPLSVIVAPPTPEPSEVSVPDSIQQR